MYEHHKAEILKAAKQMGDYANRAGAVMFSGKDTLVKGDLYIMGFNPGGSNKPKGL